MHIFEAGKGINKNKLNENFDEVKNQANQNEADLLVIAETALKKDGSNLTPEIVNQFKQEVPVVLNAGGDISLEDNKTYFLTLTGNGKIVLPAITADLYSHTIVLVVDGGQFSLNLGTTKHLVNDVEVDTTKPYNVMYVLNKIDNSWYYSITQ